MSPLLIHEDLLFRKGSYAHFLVVREHLLKIQYFLTLDIFVLVF